MSYRQYQQLQLRRQDCFMRTTIAATASEEHKELIQSIASQIMKGTEGLNNHYQEWQISSRDSSFDIEGILIMALPCFGNPFGYS